LYYQTTFITLVSLFDSQTSRISVRAVIVLFSRGRSLATGRSPFLLLPDAINKI